MPSHTPIYTHRTSKFPAATWGAFYVVSRKQSKSAANKRNCCNKPRFLLLYSHLPWIFAAWETVTEYKRLASLARASPEAFKLSNVTSPQPPHLARGSNALLEQM